MSDQLENRTSEEVLRHHLRYVQAANLEETLKDYCNESTIVAMDGPHSGLSEIREFFKGSMKDVLPVGSIYNTIQEHICGEIVCTVWSAESVGYKFPFASDTYIIRNGKIVQQTFVGVMDRK